jgi:hypothetical protein
MPPKIPGQCMTVGCNHDAAPGYDLCPVCLGRNGGVTRPEMPISIVATGYDGNQDIPDFAGILAMDDDLTIGDDFIAIIVAALNTVNTLTEQVTEQDQVIRRQQAHIMRLQANGRGSAAAIEDLTRQLVAEKSRVIGLEDQVNGLAHELAGHFLAGYIVATEPRDTSPRAQGFVFMRVVRNPDTGQEAFWLWRRYPGARTNGHRP